MDTNRLKRFATEARTILMQGVTHRLQAMGFDLHTGRPIEMPQKMDGGAVFMNDVISLDFYSRWMSLYNSIQSRSIREVAEEAAYTWFNRLMAIRIMVKNDLIPPVLQYESDGVMVPLLVTEARQGRLPEMKEEERRKLIALLDDDSKTADQFSILIVAFCHATPIINACFGQISDYTELLLPINILAEGGFIDLINHTDFIAEEDYKSPELIGWLYQFYISDRKDEAFAKKGKYDPDEIAPATQIFTPNWIVKYMVQNTIGRIYLDNNPYEEEVKKNWKYLVEPSEPTTPENILHFDDLKELKFGDLACGSGHILNEGFDILYELYILEGYSRKDTIESIFRKNLTGIDIDTRAKQLAQFALLLKACQKDGSFADAHVMPKVFDMPKVDRFTWKDLNGRLICALNVQGPDEIAYKELDECFDLMKDAESLGSIMKMYISKSTRAFIQECLERQKGNPRFEASFSELFKGFELIIALTEHYSVLVMNPPYMRNRNMTDTLAEYVGSKYTEGKADLCTAFILMEAERLAHNALYANIVPPSWMFNTSFTDFRKLIIDNLAIESLLYLGRGIFGSDFGSVSFVMKKSKAHQIGYYRKLFDKFVQVRSVDKIKEKFLDEQDVVYYVGKSNFKRINGNLFGFWLSDKSLDVLENAKDIVSVAAPKQGLATGNNDLFLKYIWEIEKGKRGKKKWVPCTKGGCFRRWYGNIQYCVNWENDGNEIKNYRDDNGKLKSRPQNSAYYFRKDGVTWSTTTAGKPSFRLFEKSCLFEHKGSVCFPNESVINLLLLGYLNTPLVEYFLELFSPSVDFLEGPLGKLPFTENIDKGVIDIINKLVQNNIDISRLDWDAHETSWDFETNPLIALCNQYKHDGCGASSYHLENFVKDFESQWTKNFNQLHQNEEELNRQFIEIYGLQNELSPDVPKDEITILQQGEISIENNELEWHRDVLMKQLISYAVGCMMGRYSIDMPGLILANQGDGIEQFNKLIPRSRFEVDDDGIVPLMSAQSDFADNATIRFKTWLSKTFGSEMLVENLNFIEKYLKMSIDDYFVKNFWKDHKKMYQNRPIYWLFSSKKGAFQCLAYMHRMDAYTVERIRTKYLLPHIEWLMQKQGELETNAANLNSVERKQLDNIVKQIAECREYHDRLHVIADQQIAFDLDDGVVVNYGKFGDVLAKIK